MPLQANWLGRNDIERIADVRLRCFGVPADREKMVQRTLNDRFDDGDVLVLSLDGVDIATATSLRLSLNVRGTILPCQGVAWVGTVRTHRRRRVDGHGLATHVMMALRQMAVERGEPASMLAPFRVSFYEHFGYGIIERQATWTIPLAVMPDGDTSGFSESPHQPVSPADVGEALVASRRRQFLATHGDVDTTARSIQYWLGELKDVGYRLIDRDGSGTVHSQFTLGTEIMGGRTIAVVHRPWWESPAALRNLIAMLGTLKDQYSAARITLPADLPINWLLKERQLPHRPVEHAAATCTLTTRMQAAIIGPVRLCAALRTPTQVEGSVTLAVRSRDEAQTWRLQFAGGRVNAESAAGEADGELEDTVFAALAFGDLSAGDASAMGRLTVRNAAAMPLLEALSAGPKPYCHEYF